MSETLREPFGALQAALLGIVGLILAFGLSLAVSRYEDRRAAIVNEAAMIDTTYLRAQTLAEPVRSRSLALLVPYTESAVRLSDFVPGSSKQRAAAAKEQQLQRALWALAGRSLESQPDASAPRLYTEGLNEMINAQTVRMAALRNRVPNSVLLLEVFGAALALGLLAAYLAIAHRGWGAIALAAVLVTLMLFVTCDLDRPTRGTIRVPATALTNQLESMRTPPAAGPPVKP